MRLLQQPAETPEALAAGEPLSLAPAEVQELDEAAWYARAYRHEAPQLTLRAIAMGSLLGFFLSFTNVYVGLKTGGFMGVNLTACLLSVALGRSLHRAGFTRSPLSILETNCAVSTASSAGYATGNMVVSAIPAMLLLSVTEQNPRGTQLAWPLVALWVFFVAALGVTLAIPMKRTLINREKLKFPSGTAAAVMLQGLHRRGGDAIAKTRALFVTAALAGLVPLVKDLQLRKSGDALLPGQSNVFDALGAHAPWLGSQVSLAGPPQIHPGGRPFVPSDYLVKLDHGVALVFAGMLIGLRVTAWMVVGGVLLVVVLTPPALDWQAAGKVAYAAASPATAWKEIGLWVGAPLLAASGLVGVAAQWRTLGRGLAALLPGRREASVTDAIEVPVTWFAGGLVVSGLGIVVVARVAFAIPIHLGVVAIAMTFILAFVACRATGESDVVPGAALGKIMQLSYGAMLPQNAAANLQAAAITAGASLASADLLTDLKSGYLLGASPRRQLVAQALGIVTGTLASTLGYFVLVPDALAITGSGARPPAFPAVGAQQWRAVAEVLKEGVGSLHPMAQQAVGWGAGLGVALALAETFVPKRHRRWLPSPIGLGLGLILPFFYPLAMFMGAAMAAIASALRARWAERYLVPIAAGGIAGESIVGVVVQALNNFVLS